MQISFQHTNPAASHDSTLLRATPREDDARRFLVDAGEGVSPGAFVGPDDSLDGVFLTHAHKDHYTSLSQVLSTDPNTSLYTSPATAAVIEQVYSEADRYQDLGDVAPITEALTPIDGWTALADAIYVLPVPAGHTPGAAGFLFRIDDPKNNETVTVLATGDFTTRPVGGYPGLTIPASIDIDIAIVNATTTPDFEDELADALETLLERALGGATTLVATSGLVGVHVAYLLGHALDAIDRELTVHLAGQAAKLYTALEYDVPHVTAHPEFEHTDDVLAPGDVTIAGPESPSQGSIARLFGVVEDDPDAVFVQLATSSPDPVDGTACATHYFELSNHPTEEQFVETVEENLPRHLIFKHVPREVSKPLGSTFDSLFYWSNDDTQVHVLYDDGDWQAPPWIDGATASRIRRRNYQQSGSRLVIDRPIDDLPTASLERESPALAAEGVDVAKLAAQFESAPSVQISTDTAGASVDGGKESSTASTDGGDGGVAEPVPHIDTELVTDITDRLETLETTLDGLEETTPTESTVESGLEALDTRLDDIEARLDELPEQLASDESPSVDGTVLLQGDLVLFRVDADDLAERDLSLEHQQEVELDIDESVD